MTGSITPSTANSSHAGGAAAFGFMPGPCVIPIQSTKIINGTRMIGSRIAIFRFIAPRPTDSSADAGHNATGGYRVSGTTTASV